MDLIRIVRILTRLNIGGPAVHAALLSTQLDAKRFTTCLVIGEPDTSEGDLSHLVQGSQTRLIRVKTLRRPIRPVADLVSLICLTRLIWRERPAIIHTHMAKAGALGRLAGVLYNAFGHGRAPHRKTVLIHAFHGHVLDGYFTPWLSRIFVGIERWLAARTDCLVAVSPAIREALLAKGIGTPDRWAVIPLGLDLSALARLPMPNGSWPIQIGMVGRLVPIKNPGLLLQALARVSQEQPGRVRGMMVGDGPLRHILEREVDKLGLGEVVRFTGWQQDLGVVYAGLEIVCLTSWNEGTPIALIEAMAAGRAVIATDVGGVRDLLASDRGIPSPIPAGAFHVAARGILVQPGDVGGLADAIKALVQDAALRQALGTAARAYAVRAFSHDRLLRDITQLYERLLARTA